MVFFYDPSNPYGGVRSGANPDEYAVRKGRGIMGYGIDPERRARIMRELRAGKKGRGIMGYGIDPERRARVMKALRERRGSGIMGYGWPGVKLKDLTKFTDDDFKLGDPNVEEVEVKVRDKENPKKFVKDEGGYYIKREKSLHVK